MFHFNLKFLLIATAHIFSDRRLTPAQKNNILKFSSKFFLCFRLEMPYFLFHEWFSHE